MTVRFTTPRRARITFGPGRALAGETNVEIDHVLAAIDVDETRVKGVALSADRSVDGRLRLSLVDATLELIRRYALVTATADAPSEADWLAGATSDTEDLSFAAAAGAPLHDGVPVRYYQVALPDALPALSDVQQLVEGAPVGFSTRFNWTPAVDDADVEQVIAGVNCRTYRTLAEQFADIAQTYRFITE